MAVPRFRVSEDYVQGIQNMCVYCGGGETCRKGTVGAGPFLCASPPPHRLIALLDPSVPRIFYIIDLHGLSSFEAIH